MYSQPSADWGPEGSEFAPSVVWSRIRVPSFRGRDECAYRIIARVCVHINQDQAGSQGRKMSRVLAFLAYNVPAVRVGAEKIT